MKTGCGGTFVISWSQTALDGFQAAPIDILTVGAAWSWGGELIRVDGPASLLRLEDADMQEDSRKRAACAVRRLVGVPWAPRRRGNRQQMTLPCFQTIMPLSSAMG